jgi:hypothetical protein
MKVVTKCTGDDVYLVYLKDDNDNSIECHEFVKDKNGKLDKESELMRKYDIPLEKYEYVSFDEYIKQKDEESEYTASESHPLILVFYLDRELMMNPKIMAPYAQSVNDVIAARKANMMAFFLPTDDKERIECINPIQIKPADMSKINDVINEIAKNFDVGQVDLNEAEDDEIITPGP